MPLKSAPFQFNFRLAHEYVTHEQTFFVHEIYGVLSQKLTKPFDEWQHRKRYTFIRLYHGDEPI